MSLGSPSLHRVLSLSLCFLQIGLQRPPMRGRLWSLAALLSPCAGSSGSAMFHAACCPPFRICSLNGEGHQVSRVGFVEQSRCLEVGLLVRNFHRWWGGVQHTAPNPAGCHSWSSLLPLFSLSCNLFPLITGLHDLISQKGLVFFPVFQSCLVALRSFVFLLSLGLLLHLLQFSCDFRRASP